MSQAVANQNSANSLTGLLVPLSDRTLLVPNVAVAELIPYRAPQVSAGMPAWFLGQPGRIAVEHHLVAVARQRLLQHMALQRGVGDDGDTRRGFLSHFP